MGFKAMADTFVGMIPHLHIHGFFIFTSGATPPDLLAASMAAELFQFTYLEGLYLTIFDKRTNLS